MKVLLYGDFRSPHARAWRAGLLDSGIQVVSVSSELVESGPIDTDTLSSVDKQNQSLREGLTKRDLVSRVRSTITTYLSSSDSIVAKLVRKITRFQILHSLVFLLRRRALVRRLQIVALEEKPDLVHSLRIPYESATVLFSNLQIPWVVSTWGADFVPQAASDPLLRYWTRKVLKSADAIHYDAKIDYQRAVSYGFNPNKPKIYAAGNFGVNSELFYESRRDRKYVVYPRKIAPTTNYWGFIEAVHFLLPSSEEIFVGIGLLPIQSEIYAKFPDLETSRFILTDALDQETYAQYIREASVVVSPGYSDGTPNSLLEAISAGASVVAGALTHLVEMDAKHSLGIIFVDPESSTSIASGISEALQAERPTFKKLPTVMRRDFNSKAVPHFYTYTLNSRS